jgi:hypothetical protein
LIFSHILSRTSRVESGFCMALVMATIPELMVKGSDDGEAGRWTPTRIPPKASLGPRPIYSERIWNRWKNNTLGIRILDYSQSPMSARPITGKCRYTDIFQFGYQIFGRHPVLSRYWIDRLQYCSPDIEYQLA